MCINGETSFHFSEGMNTCGLRESIMDRREEGFATVDSDVVNM